MTKLKSVESVIEKPAIPPPVAPTRPPPIGFNISLNDPVNTTSTTTSDISPTSTLGRPPKPALKPKPNSNVLAHVMATNQQKQQQSDDDIDSSFINETGLNSTKNNVEETNRLSSEVTSL